MNANFVAVRFPQIVERTVARMTTFERLRAALVTGQVYYAALSVKKGHSEEMYLTVYDSHNKN